MTKWTGQGSARIPIYYWSRLSEAKVRRRQAEERKIREFRYALKMDLNDMLKNIDMSISVQFYHQAGEHSPFSSKNNNQIKVVGSAADKWLVAAYQVTNHTNRVTSLERCLAASSLFMMKHIGSTQFGNSDYFRDNHTTVEVKPVAYNGSPIKNRFASSMGIPEDTIFYYTLTEGKNYLMTEYPALCSALIGFKHSIDTIKRRSGKYTGQQEDFDFYCVGEVWDNIQHKSKLSSIDKYVDDCFDDGCSYIEYLGGLITKQANNNTHLK